MKLRILSAIIPVCLLSLLLLTSCGGLSDQEKKLVGKYYNPSLSDTRPVLELNADRTAVRRAIRTGEITFSVAATWKVEHDSIIILCDTTSISIEEGDPGRVGHINPRKAIPLSGFTENNLEVNESGAIYVYQHRFD